MNRIRWSTDCLVCDKDMRWGVMDRADRMRQIANGICDPCQRARYAAAREFEAAVAEVRLLSALGATHGDRTKPQDRGSKILHMATYRLRAAEADCVRLGMWSAANLAPAKFYREEHA